MEAQGEALQLIDFKLRNWRVSSNAAARGEIVDLSRYIEQMAGSGLRSCTGSGRVCSALKKAEKRAKNWQTLEASGVSTLKLLGKVRSMKAMVQGAIGHSQSSGSARPEPDGERDSGSFGALPISDSMATFGVFTLWVVGAAVAMHLYDRSR